jgi:hypothetical protein
MYNTFSTLFRIYFYTDVHKGYGDSGTFKYVKVSHKDFTSELHVAFDKSTYIKWIPTPALMERIKDLGYDYYTMGFTFATEERYNEELNRLRTQLERLETI